MDKPVLQKEYNSIDILKFILAIFVAVIHSGVDKTVISPILRTAVPLFFIISSYFFFSKIKKITSPKEKNAALLRLMKRNVLLYFIWTAVQLPLLFFMRGYHHAGILGGALGFLKDMLLGKTFTGSWYVASLIVGAAIVFLLSKKISSGWLLILTFPLYVFCCLLTNYYNLLDPNSLVRIIGDGWTALTGLYLSTGLPVALFWISLGRFLAERALKLKTEILATLATLFVILLMLERYITLRLGSAFTDDCYLMLAFVCPIIFLLVSRCRFTFTTRFRVRELSVLIYVTHGCIGRIVGYALKLVPMSDGLFEPTKLFVTLAGAMIVGILIIFIKERYRTSVLKYIC